MHFYFPSKNSLCMIYKHFELWGHWKCPHKSPSPCNTCHTHVIIQICVLINHINMPTHHFPLNFSFCFAHYCFTVLHFSLFYCTFYFLFLFTYIYIYSCVVLLLYNLILILFFILFYFYSLHCPLSGPDLTYISLLIIPCIIYHVTNKETLNLEPWITCCG